MAKTLGELERKLLELERTLTAIGHDETAFQEAGPGPAPQQDPGFIRLIDETIERDEPAPAGVTPVAGFQLVVQHEHLDLNLQAAVCRPTR